MWEILLEMERFNYQAEEKYQGAAALDLAKAFERVSLPVVWDAFQFSLEDFACAERVFRARAERVHFEGCVAEPLQTRTAILPASKWSCLLLRVVLQDAQSEVTQIYPPLKLRVFVGDIMTSMNGRNKELVEMAEELLKKLTIEVRRRAWSYRLLKEGMKERARRSLPARRWRSSRNAAEKKELPWK